MGEPTVTVSRLRRFVHGLAALAARTVPSSLTSTPSRPSEDSPSSGGPSPPAWAGQAEGEARAAPTPREAEPALPIEPARAAGEAWPESGPAQADPRLEPGLRFISRRQWGRAQRALEELARQDQRCEASAYLAEIRAVRRCLRQLNRRPRDALLHLELGRLYFGLELADEALHEFEQAVQIEPTLAEGHFYLAVEYLFRDEVEAARGALERARELNPSLPDYRTIACQIGVTDEGEPRADGREANTLPDSRPS